jgi:hypothetical protein
MKLDCMRGTVIGAVFDSNAALATSRFGKGGAIQVDSGDLRLEKCRITRNVARMCSNDAYGATGGGVSVGPKGALSMIGVYLSSNWAGGTGLAESSNAMVDAAKANLARRSLHLANSGLAVLQQCVFEGARAGDFTDPTGGFSYIVGQESAHLVLNESSASGSAPEGLLRLFDAAQAAVLSCQVTGVTIGDAGEAADGGSETMLGILNTTFEPALPAATSTIGPPNCGAPIAGLPAMCDPRAACIPRSSGGVECHCKGDGLRTRPGFADDGRTCQREPSLIARLMTPEVQLLVSKPGMSNQPLRLQLTAEGEGGMRCSYSIEATLWRRSQQGRFEEVQRSLGNWPLDNFSAAAFGTHFRWVAQPGMVAVFSLDPAKQVFLAQEQHEFSVGVDCRAGPSICPADGDRIVTTVRIQTADVGLATGISITSDIFSIPSCNLSRARLSLGESSLTIQVEVMDADNISVGYSTPDLLADWSLASDAGSRASTTAVDAAHRPLMLVRVASNLFTATISEERRAIAGVYRLRVRLANGWDHAAKSIVTECTLLEQAVEIEPESQLNTMVVLGGSAGACALLVLGLIVLIRRYRKNLEHVMTALITEVRKAHVLG